MQEPQVESQQPPCGDVTNKGQGSQKVSFDHNMYATKKTAAQAMMDVALLTANASQLKTLLSVGLESNFYIALLVLLVLSITLQCIVGVLLIFIARGNLNKTHRHRTLHQMNDASAVLIFLTVFINIIISALGIQDHSDSVTPSTISLFKTSTTGPGDVNSTVEP